MSIKFYVLGGPRYKPPGVSRRSPRLHFIIMFMLMQLFVCWDRNKVQFKFNSKPHQTDKNGSAVIKRNIS